MADCEWLEQRRIQAVIDAVFAQVCEEAGLAPHPAGECPSADCRCEDLADAIETRAVQLIEERLGVSLKDL